MHGCVIRRFGRVLASVLLGAAAASASAQHADLMQIYGLALANDPSFQAAGAINRAAQEAPVLARSDLLPSLSASVNTFGNEAQVRRSNLLTGGTGRRNFNTHEAQISVSQPLYRKDRWIALDQARVEVDQADATYAFEHQALMLRAAQRYFEVLSATDTLEFALAERDAFGQQLEQSQQRFEVGLIAVTDVEEAKAGFDLARAQVIQAETALDNAREALRELTGEYHLAVAGLRAETPLEMPQPNEIDRWTETALLQNLQLAGQRYASERAKLEIQRVESGHLPTLDLVGSHRRAVANGGTSVNSAMDNSITAIGIELNVPLYAGGSVLSRTRQSRHLYQREVDEVERVRRSVHRQTRDAFLGVRSGISRVGALEQAVKSSEAAADAVEAGFQVGTRTTVDVLNAKRDLFRAKRDLADARYSYIVDTLTLKQAAGIIEEEDLRLVNSWLR
jgi:outer membrane protein